MSQITKERTWEQWVAEDQRRWARALRLPVARIRRIDGGRWPWSDRGHAVVARLRRRREFVFRRDYPWILAGMSRDLWERLQRVKAEQRVQEAQAYCAWCRDRREGAERRGRYASGCEQVTR